MTTLAPPVPSGDVVERSPKRSFNVHRLIGGLIVVAMFVFGFWSLTKMDFSLARIEKSLDQTRVIFSKMDPISFPSFTDLCYLVAITLAVCVLGTVMAAVISVPVAYLAAANTAPARWARFLGRAIGVLARAVPDIVVALVVAFMFALGSTLPGIIAFGVHSVGMISKLFADAIEQIDEGPVTAIKAAGGSRAQQFWSGVFPQVLPSWIATTLHRFDINLRGSVILGYAGVGGLGYRMRKEFEDFPAGYGPGLGVAIVIFLLCVIMELVSSTIRRNLLGVQPTGKGLGDSIMRAVTRNRAARPLRPGVAPAPVPAPQTVEESLRRPWTKARVRDGVWGWIAVAVIVGSLFASTMKLEDAKVRLGNPFEGFNWAFTWKAIKSFWPPNMGSYEPSVFIGALFNTIQVAFAAAFLTFFFSLVLGSFAARNVAPNGIVRNVFRVILVVIRGVPELVLAIFLIMITGLGNQAGVVALAFGGIGLLGKLIGDSFEEVPRGPETALSAAGATRTQRYVSATLPQGIPSLIGNSLYLVDTNIRSASILGVVGGGGIGFYLLNSASLLTTHGQVTTIVIMICVTVLIVEGIATYLRHVFK